MGNVTNLKQQAIAMITIDSQSTSKQYHLSKNVSTTFHEKIKNYPKMTKM